MTTPFKKIVGARIKTHRKRKGVTQAAVAEHLDCEVTTVGRYERGEHALDSEQLVKLAHFFGVSPLDFLPTEIDVRWQVVMDLRSTLVDLIYQIDDPALLATLIANTKAHQKG